MSDKSIPNIFRLLLTDKSIGQSDIAQTPDGFFMVYKSIANILSTKDIFDFPDSSGERLACNKFFDDWFLYAVPDEDEYTYSLLKLREQEHDAEDGAPADGDTPGVTISFIAFNSEILLRCLAESTDENRKKLNTEINRVVAYKGQHHHKALRKYFKNPQSQGAYLVAAVYIEKRQGRIAPAFRLLRHIQHVLNKNPIPSGGLIDKDVCDCSHNSAILDYRTARHE
jgi:hypothetical protein